MASQDTPTGRRTRWGRALCVLAAVLLVMATAWVTHMVCWNLPHRPESGGTVLFESISKPMSNLFQTMAAPGWILVWKSGGGSRGPIAAAIAIGVSALLWTLPAGMIIGLRHWLIGGQRRTDDQDANRTLVSRRRLLVDGAIGATGVAAAGAGAVSVFGATSRLEVRRHDIAIDGLPGALDGLLIAHVSDLHLGPRVPGSFLDDVVARTLDARPDLVLLTGDYVHAGLYQFDELAAILAPLADPARVPSGAIGVLGNHDWYNAPDQVRDTLIGVGVKMVDNGRVFLDETRRVVANRPPAGLCVAGLGDLYEDDILPERAFDGVDDTMPRLVLAHNPDTAEERVVMRPPDGAGPPRIDLMLSGHTHGGQIRLPLIGTPLIPSRFGPKYAGGLVQGPTCRVLVSRGVGVSIVPVRWGVPAEIGLVTLRQGSG